ncbi:MAG: nitronate monooxygenase, partial [Desulfobacterales bacterium]|nr:nitronate monooxygenase [Desulfobacterales bacterium]
GIVACGQGVGISDDIPTIKELFVRMNARAEAAVGGLL